MAEGSLALLAWEEGAPLRGAAREDAVLRCFGRVPSPLLGVRAAEMVGLRIARFGAALQLAERCPACGETLGAEVDLAALADALPPAMGSECLDDGVPGGVARLRRPTLDDLAAIAAFEDAASAREALRVRLFGDGLGVDAGEAALEALDPWSDLTIALDCPACDHAFDRFLDIGAILWGDVEAEAQSLLDEVARLAHAFGWSEPELLAMPPARRRAYLERLG
jgi:hypothetical protein